MYALRAPAIRRENIARRSGGRHISNASLKKGKEEKERASNEGAIDGDAKGRS